MWDRILSVLTDEELRGLSTAFYNEQKKRMKAKIESGNFDPLSPEEARLVAEGKTIDAIKAYRHRTGCFLMEAKEIVERFKDDKRRDGL